MQIAGAKKKEKPAGNRQTNSANYSKPPLSLVATAGNQQLNTVLAGASNPGWAWVGPSNCVFSASPTFHTVFKVLPTSTASKETQFDGKLALGLNILQLVLTFVALMPCLKHARQRATANRQKYLSWLLCTALLQQP